MEKHFKVVDENNVEREADLITILNHNNKEYAIYSINRDKENVNVFASILEKNAIGETLKDIEDIKEKEEVSNKVKELISKID